jgi:hypothetical protein
MTSKNTVIRNLAGLARLLGSRPTIDAVSRRVYKGTECGAWVAETQAALPPAERRFQVAFEDTQDGPAAVLWRPGRRVAWRLFTKDAAPEGLVFFLTAGSDAGSRESPAPRLLLPA